MECVLPPPAALIGFAILTARETHAAYVATGVQTTSIHRAAVVLEAGYEYEIVTADCAAGVDPFMHLAYVSSVSGDGSQHLVEVAQNDDIDPSTGNYNARVYWTPATTATYQVIVRAWSVAASGYGKVRLRRRPVGGAWGAYSDVSTSVWFGGKLVTLEPNKREYWTRLVQPAAGGFDDTVVYALSSTGGYGIERIIGYDDDSGVGHMSRYTLPAGKYTDLLLVGTFGNGTSGQVDVLANDKDADADGDGLGAGLEAALGICDATTAPGCSAVLNLLDSDHDGLTDFHEVLGVDHASWDQALHLPGWGADPRKKDVFVEVDFSTDWAGATNPFTQWYADKTQQKFSVAPQTSIKNLVGGGVFLHFDIGKTGDPCPTNRTLCGAWGGGGDKTNAHFAPGDFRKGKFRHLTALPSQGVATVAGDELSAGLLHGGGTPTAQAITHELGHSVGLQHGGNWSWDASTKFGDGDINCKPTYVSLMNYAFDVTPSEFDAEFNFSFGTRANADPRRTFETLSPGAYPHWSWLSASAPRRTGHNLPVAQSDGQLDLNRDGVLTSGAVRSVLASGRDQCGVHWLVFDTLAPQASVGSVSPSITRHGDGKLVAVYAPFALNGVRYKTTSHTGTSNKASCDAGEARPWEPCHGWSAEYSMPVGSALAGGSVDAVSATWWGSTTVVAFKTSDRKIWANVATGVDGAGQLTGWLTEPVLLAADADSGDIHLGTMYVSTAPPASFPQDEVLALFYTTGAGGSANHRMRWATSPTATWTTRDPLLAGGASVDGDESPVVAVWPGRSRGGPSFASVGGACGVFPARISGPTRSFRFLCYDKSTDRWTDRTTSAGLGGVSLGRRPTLAFHTLRAGVAAGSGPTTPVSLLGDGTQGVFLLATQDGGRTPWVNVSTGVSATSPPGATLQFKFVETSWPQRNNVSLTLYADRDLTSVKGIGLPTRDGVSNLAVGGVFDGAVSANLADGDDFTVMERGICHGIQGGTFCQTPTVGGQTYFPGP